MDSAVSFPNTYPLDSVIYPVDTAIHWISLYPLGSAIIGFRNTCLLDSDLWLDSAIQPLNNQGVV